MVIFVHDTSHINMELQHYAPATLWVVTFLNPVSNIPSLAASPTKLYTS